jgi:hypothetical protein
MIKTELFQTLCVVKGTHFIIREVALLIWAHGIVG